MRTSGLRAPSSSLAPLLHVAAFNYFHFALRLFTTSLRFELPLETAPRPHETNYLTGLREVSGCRADCSVLTVFRGTSGVLSLVCVFPTCAAPACCWSVRAWCISVSCPISDEQIFPRDSLQSALIPPSSVRREAVAACGVFVLVGRCLSGC